MSSKVLEIAVVIGLGLPLGFAIALLIFLGFLFMFNLTIGIFKSRSFVLPASIGALVLIFFVLSALYFAAMWNLGIPPVETLLGVARDRYIPLFAGMFLLYMLVLFSVFFERAPKELFVKAAALFYGSRSGPPPEKPWILPDQTLAAETDLANEGVTERPLGHAAPESQITDETIVDTSIPARLDRLPWGRFHTLVVAALGVTWILNGLEVTLAGVLAGALTESPRLHLSETDVGLANGAYLGGLVFGAVFFGWLTDRLGRRKLLFVTLSIYFLFTAFTATSWDIVSLAFFRFMTGAGIGGEYTAVNSTIQELIPARVRGRIDLLVNGSLWIGGAIAAAGSLVLLNPSIIDPDLGWRLAFLIGAALSIIIFFLRWWIPESPRWLMTHGRAGQAEKVVTEIESGFTARGYLFPTENLKRIRIHGRRITPLSEVALTLFQKYPKRTMVGISLMAAQALFYNAIFFTYALALKDFFHIPSDQVGWYLLPIAAGNFLGPLLLGGLFDIIGRKQMIFLTFSTSGLLLAFSGYLFTLEAISAQWQTFFWMVIFFFASAAASAAYLTVGEIFPLEIRALAIALFFAIGTGLGGVLSPIVFAYLIHTGSRLVVFAGYFVLSIIMIAAAVIESRWGIEAEGKSLEDVATPLTLVV